MMIANKGDVIKWEFRGDTYLAEVDMIRHMPEDFTEYGVYVYYEGRGLTQDLIKSSDVLQVWKK